MINESQRYKVAFKVSITTILANLFLSIGKVLIGFFGKSNAMIADGMHSFSDVVSTIGVLIGLKLSSKEADKEHPYGHDRIESLSSLLLSIMLFMVAIGIGISGIKNIISGTTSTPHVFAVLGAVISILVKEWMFYYTLKYSKLINSPSLKADAWHHRSDSLSSIGALIGIVGSILGYPILDSLVAVVICIIILKVSFDIFMQSITQMIDQSASDDIVQEIEDKINSVDGVKNIDNLKTRLYANRIYVDVEIAVDGDLTVTEGHDIADAIHDLIEQNSAIKHCMVHVNPYIKEKVHEI
ncbi:cation diffusion facilitator family transporter [uncultured Clostridium sp.]|uniref:cation diffusion facilitator family transporter n=1 Tax=uncultured Clostridium sp. TaxID=59620 RepID=UPI0025FE562F|nr:cation diffusion facilitator family transporter [uncultured Clostridium sp.]